MFAMFRNQTKGDSLLRYAKIVILTFITSALLLAGNQWVAPAQVLAATNCDTLPARISANNADANNYNAQVNAINARGGGTPGQVAYYNAWKARGLATQNQLRAELAQCQSQGKLRNVQPPTGPGGPGGKAPGAPGPSRPAPPQTGPTPGYPNPQRYPPRSNVIGDRELRDGSRVVNFRGGGTVTYNRMIGGRSTGGSAVVSRAMLNGGTGSAPRVVPPGFGGRYSIRGHVIADRLGGLGGDARNIVALTRSANARMSTIENKVYRALGTCRGTVRYTVSPIYIGLTYPGFIWVTAYGCGLSINQIIPN